MSKKADIIKMFQDHEWLDDGYKLFTYEDFSKSNLYPCHEFGDKWCDIYYAMKIFRQMGYRCMIGTYAIYVHREGSRYFKSLAGTSHPTGKTVANVPNKHPKR